MKALAAGPVRFDRVATIMGCDGRRAERLADDLQREGLIVRTGHEVLLP
jgi:hypothetical protein